jgi:ethanolamine utilization protein EutN
MKIARVAQTVVSTIHSPVFDGRRLLLCDLLEPTGEPAGGYLIAVDTVGAGSGETVLLLDEGNSARQVIGVPGAPVRTLVVGIVDEVALSGPGGETLRPGIAPVRAGEGTRQSRAAARPDRAAATGRSRRTTR